MVPRKGTESEIVDILISRPRISSTNKSSYLDMILSEESDSSVYKDGSQEGKNKKQFNPSKRQIAIDYISGMIERNQELESVAKLSSGEITCDGIKNNARMNCLLKMIEYLPPISRGSEDYLELRRIRRVILALAGKSELEAILEIRSPNARYTELYDYYRDLLESGEKSKTYNFDRKTTEDTVMKHILNNDEYTKNNKITLAALIYGVYGLSNALEFVSNEKEAFAKVVATSPDRNVLSRIFKEAIGEDYKTHIKFDLGERIEYDEQCFSMPSYNRSIISRVTKNGWDLYEDKSDPHGISGVYTIELNEAHSEDEIESHMNNVINLYNKHIFPIFYEKNPNQPSSPKGLITTTIPTPGGTGKSDRTSVSIDISLDTASREVLERGDAKLGVYYRSEETGRIIKRDYYWFSEILTELPKEFKKIIRNKDPAGYNKIQNLINAYRQKPVERKTYTMTISTRNADILRASACQHWDQSSCLNPFNGCNRWAIESYAKFETYIAYLTENSTNEPRWLARLFIHRCNNCLSIQDRGSHYSVKPHYWFILYDAVKVLFNQRGINIMCDSQCDWSSYGWNKYNKAHGFSDDDDDEEDDTPGRPRGYFDYTDTAAIQKITDDNVSAILKRRCRGCRPGEFIKLIEK